MSRWRCRKPCASSARRASESRFDRQLMKRTARSIRPPDSSIASYPSRSDEVLERLALVWRSAFSDRNVAYRRARGLSPPRRAPAVLIQRMVDADVAGVAFGADPLSTGRDVAVISAVYGLGSSLVSGECDADTFRVSRDGDIVDREIAVKRVAHRVAGRRPLRLSRGRRAGAARQAAGTRRSAGAAGRVPGPSRRAAFRRAAGRRVGVRAGDGLHLLQSRPITTPGGSANPGGVLNLWDNSNIAESYSGITTPLTFSFARHVYEEVYRQFCRLVRVPAAEDRGARRHVPPHARADPRAGLLQPIELVSPARDCCRDSRSIAASWSR